jgi:hypothetical protein
MSSNLTQIEQSAEVSAELANAYVIGALTTAAALPGGAELQAESSGLLADLGIDIIEPVTETGIGAAVVGVRAALAAAVKSAGSSLAKDPKKWAIAIGIATAATAGSVGLYDWMTEDQQIALAAIREDAALKAKALASLPPEDRARIAEIIAHQTPQLGTGPPLWPFLLAGGALAAWFVFFKDKDK